MNIVTIVYGGTKIVTIVHGGTKLQVVVYYYQLSRLPVPHE